MRNDSSPSVFRQIDWPLVIIYLLIVIAGVFSIYAASYDFDEASILSFDEFSGKQIRWIGLGLVLGCVVLLTDYRVFETYAYLIYGILLVLLLVTPFIAPDIKGSRSWLVIGPMSLQPAEFAKVATALALAKLFNGYNFTLKGRPGNYLRAILLFVVPILLILNQNETGSALAYTALVLVLYREGMSGLILFAGVFAVAVFVIAVKYTEELFLGIPGGEFTVMVLVMLTMVIMAFIYGRTIEIARNLLAGFAACLLILWILGGPVGLALPGRAIMICVVVAGCIYLAFEALKRHISRLSVPIVTAVLAIGFMFSVNSAFDQLQPHQQQRIRVVLGIEEDLRGAGYNVNQSKIAIGSGGLEGKGFMNGTQTKLKYVPEQDTDFIFCTVGEEEGFLGSAAVLLLFLAMILRLIYLSERQSSTFGRVYGYSVLSILLFHVFINIGMVMGLTPVIGIPLPFFSYGGSSLWGFTLMLFIFLRIDAGRKRRN